MTFSLRQVNKRFVTSYLHVHGKLITKIGWVLTLCFDTFIYFFSSSHAMRQSEKIVYRWLADRILPTVSACRYRASIANSVWYCAWSAVRLLFASPYTSIVRRVSCDEDRESVFAKSTSTDMAWRGRGRCFIFVILIDYWKALKYLSSTILRWVTFR